MPKTARQAPKPGLGKVVKGINKTVEDLKDRLRRLAVEAAQQMGLISATQQVHSDIIEKLDINTQVLAKMVREAYGKLEQADVYLGRVKEEWGKFPDASELSYDLTSQEAREVRDRADELFSDVMKEMFRQVHEEREAAKEEHRKAAQKEKEEAEKAQKAKAEAERAEESLQEAESKIVGEPGGQGSSIPEGAEVFGG